MRALLVLVLLSACGAKGPLAWPEGRPPAPPPGVEAPVSSESMQRAPAEAAPDRVDDPVRRAEDRADDEFDLPPTDR